MLWLLRKCKLWNIVMCVLYISMYAVLQWAIFVFYSFYVCYCVVLWFAFPLDFPVVLFSVYKVVHPLVGYMRHLIFSHLCFLLSSSLKPMLPLRVFSHHIVLIYYVFMALFKILSSNCFFSVLNCFKGVYWITNRFPFVNVV